MDEHESIFEINEVLEEHTLRYNVLQLFKTNTKGNILPLGLIEFLLEGLFNLQLLRFAIDYYTQDWLGYDQPALCYLDLSFYFRSIAPNNHHIVIAVAIAYMTIYLLTRLIVFLRGKASSNIALNLLRLYFIVTKNLLFIPLVNSVLSLFRRETDSFNFVHSSPTTFLKFVAVVIFILFAALLLGQTYFNFQFLRREGMDRGRKSAYVPTAVLAFFVLNEVVFLFMGRSEFLVLNLLSGLLIVLFVVKDEHLNERTKLIELSFLGLNMLAYLVLDVALPFSSSFSPQIFLMLGFFLVGAILQLRTHSLEYEIQNINKWPTSDIIMRYASNLRYYLRAQEDYIYNVAAKGYMEWHRHKCEIEECPSRLPLTENELKLFQSEYLKKEDEDLLRYRNVIKKIYSDGYRESPVSDELQLQNAIFLYEIGDKEIALKLLLQVEFSALEWCNYYRYSLLKEQIHRELSEQPDIQFLDLVSELRVKHEEDEIINKLEKAALINLDFWSTLNEDHPDFLKLKELALQRIEIREEIQKSYALITSIANSERITGLYVHYLEAIENDQSMFNNILEGVREEYRLEEKIVLKDWGNTSRPIMVISTEQQTYGTILDANSTCGMLLGYEKYQLVNHTIDLLLPTDLGSAKEFLSMSNQEQTFFLRHKSGYLIKTGCTVQSYNSMSTGMAMVVTLRNQLGPQTCFFAITKESDMVVGVSSSVISLLGLEEKTFDDKMSTEQIFMYDFAGLLAIGGQKEKLIYLSQIIQKAYEDDIPGFNTKQFRLQCSEFMTCKALTLRLVHPHQKQGLVEPEDAPTFEFQIQATLDSFKFFGCFNSHEAYLSQFSQLSYAESLKQGATVSHYDEGIKTLRLKDNIIQVIEENEQEDVQGPKGSLEEISSEVMQLGMKDEEQIFSSRGSFVEFIEGYSMAHSILVVMVMSKLFLFALFIFIAIVMAGHADAISKMSSEMIFNNLMSGAIAKQLVLVQSIQQMQAGQFYQDYPDYLAIYNDNLHYSSEIKFSGGEQYDLSVFLGAATVNFLNHEFFLSLLDNSNVIGNALSKVQNSTQALQFFGSAERKALSYLSINCLSSKDAVFRHSDLMLAGIKKGIDAFLLNELWLMLAGLTLVVVVTIFKIVFLKRINREAERILQIFLDVNDVQIQMFTSKTERFLNLVHAQDLNGEIDVDEEVENTKKLSSSTFSKKKRFRNLQSIDIFVYLFIIAAAVYSGFLFHAFVISYRNLQFQAKAARYFFQTSATDYTFYSALAQIQAALLSGEPPASVAKTSASFSRSFLEFQKQYFELHYNTYGKIQPFHNVFTAMQMTDICSGTPTSFGSTSIPISCQLPELYPNGSYLVFIDMAMRTETIRNASDLNDSYLLDYGVVSLAQRKLSQSLIIAQKAENDTTRSSVIRILVVWILTIVVLGTIFISWTKRVYVDGLNKTKNILTVIPLSIARTLPKLAHYCSSIVASCKTC